MPVHPYRNRSGLSFSGYGLLLVWLVFTAAAPRHSMADSADSLAPGAPSLVAEDILPILEDVLQNAGASSAILIELTHPRAVLPASAASLTAAAATSVTLSKTSGRFVVRFSDPLLAQPITLTGFARTPLSVPVLINALTRGDMITASNLEWITTTKARPGAILTDAENLEGMIARRPLRAGQLLYAHDVTKPVLVTRGALITMQYEKAGLSLSHRAIAEESGGAGDIITVRNPRTDRVIRALVSGQNRVEVIAVLGDTSGRRANRSITR